MQEGTHGNRWQSLQKNNKNVVYDSKDGLLTQTPSPGLCKFRRILEMCIYKNILPNAIHYQKQTSSHLQPAASQASRLLDYCSELKDDISRLSNYGFFWL